jgi:hypothetical protein
LATPSAIIEAMASRMLYSTVKYSSAKARLYCFSNQGLAKIKPEYILEWEKDWIKYDREIFQYPDTIGTSGFISYSGTEIVGFASYDPRKHPIEVIGHN